jgi:hypothetical protein
MVEPFRGGRNGLLHAIKVNVLRGNPWKEKEKEASDWLVIDESSLSQSPGIIEICVTNSRIF